MSGDADTEPVSEKEVNALAAQARALRRGKEVWRPGWMDFGVVKRV